MTPSEIANLEHARRSALAWTPEGDDGWSHYATLLTAVVPALGFLAACAALLLAVL